MRIEGRLMNQSRGDCHQPCWANGDVTPIVRHPLLTFNAAATRSSQLLFTPYVAPLNEKQKKSILCCLSSSPPPMPLSHHHDHHHCDKENISNNYQEQRKQKHEKDGPPSKNSSHGPCTPLWSPSPCTAMPPPSHASLHSIARQAATAHRLLAHRYPLFSVFDPEFKKHLHGTKSAKVRERMEAGGREGSSGGGRLGGWRSSAEVGLGPRRWRSGCMR
ncbi:hypothetical protein FIBSPDRAFT_316349 [Athelia psychrophila]|uniref:Uncharacterized protein n=1 Tax=Athelia psychrophila TaxID=1759441 RepID=A0A167WYG2_9AGAM|nr:hypothetical protein FIBSPDRAFT_316349 [Fibularhizoctonia sp. CBS 109695]